MQGQTLKANGGNRADAFLAKLDSQLANPPTIKVGFLDGATYGNGMNTATVALIQEYGGTAKIPEREITNYRKLNKKGTGFLKGGKFVKKSQSNFSSTHTSPAHSVTIPPRPFFRNAINKHKGEWGKQAAELLRKNKFDLQKTAGQMGKLIKGEVQQSIVDTNSPPNAASTIARKKSSVPLIDSGFMLSRVDFEVTS